MTWDSKYNKTRSPRLFGELHRTRGRKPFCGVDGEGGNVDGEDVYMLLRAGEFAAETGKNLGWKDCFEFLADLPKDRIYVSFFFDYDVTMMTRGIGENKLQRLVMDRELRTNPDSSFVMPIDVGPFQIDYMPHKEFMVRRKGKGSQWTRISDVGTFFQCSFVTALRAWFPESEWKPVIDKIAEGKEQRNSFGRVTEYEREYNKLEIMMLERLMTRFRDVCDGIELAPHKWQGPGNLASAAMRKYGIPRTKQLSVFKEVDGLAEAANAAYYGGRFEAAAYGDIEGPIHAYDINSAYPSVYRRLPCLVHGRWIPISRKPQSGLYLARVRFWHEKRLRFNTLPIRMRDGSIIFPNAGNGWYWSHELRMAERNGANVWVGEGWRYETDCDCDPFRWVPDMYAERKRLGKSDKGMVLKLVLNSLYGKLAQSVGSPPYANPINASLITSMTRAQLGEAALMVDGGDDVIMLATDGMFCRKPRDLAVSGVLGEWEYNRYESMFVVQSGIYLIPGKDPKTRGVPMRKVVEYEGMIREAWGRYLEYGNDPVVTLPMRQFIGVRLALARGKVETAGTWPEVSKELRVDWSTKRIGGTRVGNAVWTNAPTGSIGLVTTPYSKSIGALAQKEVNRWEFDDAPDWADAI